VPGGFETRAIPDSIVSRLLRRLYWSGRVFTLSHSISRWPVGASAARNPLCLAVVCPRWRRTVGGKNWSKVRFAARKKHASNRVSFITATPIRSFAAGLRTGFQVRPFRPWGIRRQTFFRRPSAIWFFVIVLLSLMYRKKRITRTRALHFY